MDPVIGRILKWRRRMAKYVVAGKHGADVLESYRLVARVAGQ